MENELEKNSNQEVCYILNGRVWFYPESHALIYDSHGNKKLLSLNTPASRCFMLLINNRYNVVSREEFIDNVWKSFGRVVALNTFYQNISILRKSLFSAGLDKDIILTMPRRGLVLNKNIIIEKSKSADINDFLKAVPYSNESVEFKAPVIIQNKGTYNHDENDDKKTKTNSLGLIVKILKRTSHFSNRKISIIHLFFIFLLIGAFELIAIYII